MKWISVKDRLPELEQEVLVFWGGMCRNKYESGINISYMRRDHSHECYYKKPQSLDSCSCAFSWHDDPCDGGCGFNGELVTHWMPLPEKPHE